MPPRRNASVDLVQLPSLLRELAEAHGVAAALRFAADFGGREIMVPTKASPDHPIAKSIGLPALRWLIAARYPGEKIDVPLGPLSTYRKTIEATRRLVEQEAPTADIVRKLGVHTRTVRRHRSARKRRPVTSKAGQPGLFD